MSFSVSTSLPMSSAVPGCGRRASRLASPMRRACLTTLSMARKTRRVSRAPAVPTDADKAIARQANSRAAESSTPLTSSSEPATWMATGAAPPVCTGRDTMRRGSSLKLGRVSKTVSPAASRASRLAGVGSRVAPRLALCARTSPCASTIWTSRSRRTRDGGAVPTGFSCTRTGCPRFSSSMPASVSARARSAPSSCR